MGIIGFLAVPLGYVMRAIYGAVQNYGVAIILFTALVKVCLLPLTIHQQKSTAKMSVFNPMIQEIQKKYAKDQERAQEEMMKLQEEYGFSPTAGCAPMALNLLIMFGVIELVYRPLQYVLMIGSDALSEAVALLGMAARDYRGQVLLIQTIKGMSVDAAAAQFTSLTTDQITAIQGFQMNFLGIDLCATPQMALNALLIRPGNDRQHEVYALDDEPDVRVDQLHPARWLLAVLHRFQPAGRAEQHHRQEGLRPRQDEGTVQG